MSCQSRIWDGFSSAVLWSPGCSHQLELIVRAQALTQARASLQWSPLVLKTCWDYWHPGMLLLEGRDHAGVCRLCRQVAEGTKGKEPEEEVRESTVTTAGECKIQKTACCDPAKKNSKEKKPASILRCHLWLIWLFLVPTYSFLP